MNDSDTPTPNPLDGLKELFQEFLTDLRDVLRQELGSSRQSISGNDEGVNVLHELGLPVSDGGQGISRGSDLVSAVSDIKIDVAAIRSAIETQSNSGGQ